MDKLDKLIEQYSPNPFPPSPSDPTWFDGRYVASNPIKDRRDEEEDEEEDEENKGDTNIMDNLLWACKMVLIDQLDNSQTLKEQITYKEKERFEKFIEGLNLEQTLSILSEKPNISGEEYRGLLDLGWPKRMIDKMGTDEAKAAFWDGIKPEETVSSIKTFKPETFPVKTFSTGGFAPGEEVAKRMEDTKKGVASKLGIPWGKVAIGVGIATLLAIGGYYIYKRYKDQCRKQCKDSKDSNCLNKCRQVAARAAISKLQATKSACGKDQKCISKADKEIKKWQIKLGKLEKESISWGVVKQLKSMGKSIPPPSRSSSYSSGSKKIIYSTPKMSN